MEKKYIKAIILIATVALVGLIVMQFYWVNNAFSIKDETFKQKVERAMFNVSDNIEKMEKEKLLRNRGEIGNLKNSLDSIEKDIFCRLSNIAKTDSSFKDLLLAINSEDKYSFNSILSKRLSEDSLNNTKSGILIESPYTNESDNRKIFEKLTSDPKLNELLSMKKRLEIEIMNRSYLLNDIFKDLSFYFQSQPIQERIDYNTLDSLIKDELMANNINTEYEFGVYVPTSNMITLQKTGNYSSELIDYGIKVPLFKHSYSTNFLIIYFPNEKHFIYSRIATALILSALLIAMVIFSFIYIVKTVLKQKKLSDLTKDFINNMTHEFKTPISTINLACETLKDKDFPKTEETINAYVNVIDEENKRISSMAEKILQSAVIDSGRLKLNLEKTDLKSLINGAIKNIKLQIESRNGMILTDFRAKNNCVYVDKVHFTSVIINLLENANKYTTDTPVIRIITEDAVNGIFVVVEDNGIGISKADQKKIFEKMYRVPTGNRHDVKGFGLGLSYVKAIVEGHNGTITVESELKKGTKFKIFLPTIQK